jgi:hypothetical protein
MSLDRDWRAELLWGLSCFLSLMATLVPVAAAQGVYGARYAGLGMFEQAVGWTIVAPIQILFAFWPFYASGALSTRLLVPLFAGAHPRAVTSVFCTGAVVLGVWITTMDPLSVLAYGGAALVWALIMPLPLKDLLSYGPAAGGLIIGLGTAAVLNIFDGMFVTIIWSCWRLYRDRYTEVWVVAPLVAALPLMEVLIDPRSAFTSSYHLYVTMEIALLLVLAMAAIVLGEFIHGPDEADDQPREAGKVRPTHRPRR